MLSTADPKENRDLFPPSRRKTHYPSSNSGGEEIQEANGESLVEIVAACQGGDRTAFRHLYDSCQQIVYGLAARMVGLQDATDVTQQVFLQVFRSIGQFNGRSRFETWLYRLVVNESLQHQRRSRRWKYHALDREPMDESYRGGDAEHKELLDLVLARIEPELRSIFLLREVEELSYREIAEVLQIVEGTVGSRLNRARRELRQQLLQLGFEF